MNVSLAETQIPAGEVQDVWGDYQPNKPRLLLTPTLESQVALAAFFNSVQEREIQELRRLYRPCVPLNTFSRPEAIFPEDAGNPYELITHATQDFEQMNSSSRVRLQNPRFGELRFDNARMMVARFADEIVFEDIRDELTDDAVASIRLQCEEVEKVTVDRTHLPNTIMPIGRTYRDQQIEKVSRQLISLFEKDFPEQIELIPRLMSPTIKAVHASYPQKCHSDLKRRLAAHKKTKGRECSVEEESLVDLISNEQDQDLSLWERALRHARDNPDHEVRFFGDLPGNFAPEVLRNLQISASSQGDYLHIQM